MNKKKVLFVIFVCIAMFSCVLFAMYKFFVTPDIIVGIALNNAAADLKKSTEFFADSDEEEVIDRFLKNGGSTELNMTISEAELLKGVNAKLTSNSDGVCTVSEIRLNENFTFETYKDRERVFINTPLFNGGFEIELNDISRSIADSIFSDKLPESPGTLAAPAVLSYLSGGSNELFNKLTDGIKAAVKDAEKNGKCTVMHGNKTKKADMYTVKLASDDADKIISIISDCADKMGFAQVGAENILNDIRTDCTLVFKIKNFELYEICIETENDSKTLAFTGEGNQFDCIMYYENDAPDKSVKRYHDRRGNNIVEQITIGENTVLAVDKTADKTEIRIGTGEAPFVISASGKTVGDYYISYRNLEFGIEDRFMIESDLYLTEVFDEDFGFNKSGEYIKFFDITEKQWEATSNVLLAGINIK